MSSPDTREMALRIKQIQEKGPDLNITQLVAYKLNKHQLLTIANQPIFSATLY
jgi:hypothetical protein